MAYVLPRGTRKIAGVAYRAGDVVDVSGLTPYKVMALARLGIIVEVPDTQKVGVTPGHVALPEAEVWELRVRSADLTELKEMAEERGVDTSPPEGRDRLSKVVLQDRLLSTDPQALVAVGDEIEGD